MAVKKPSKKEAEKKRKERKLTPAQELFCYLYIVQDLSQYEAYIQAYPDNIDKPRKGVEANASKLANKPHIQAECQRLLDELNKSVEINKKMIVNRLMQIAFGSNSSDANAIKALDKLAKIGGLYQEEKTITHQVIQVGIVDNDTPKLEDNGNGQIIGTSFEVVDIEEGEDE